MLDTGYDRSSLDMDPESTLNSLYTRLENLEKCIYGTTLSSNQATSTQSHSESTISDRLQFIHQRLETLEKEVPWISKKLQDFQTQSPQFFTSTSIHPLPYLHSSNRSPFEDPSKAPIEAKLGLIQSSLEDVKKANKQIQEIVELESQMKLDVFEELQKKNKELTELQVQTKPIEKSIKDLNEFVNNLVRVYGTQIESLSEIFLSMDFFLKQEERTIKKSDEEI